MGRGLAGLGLAFAAAAALLAFTFRASLPGRADFTFANGTEPKTLDPGRATGEPEGRIVDALFEGLTSRDPATLRAGPGRRGVVGDLGGRPHARVPPPRATRAGATAGR